MFALLGLVVACGPVYETQYQIVPPKTETGRMCANNCLLMQQNCQQSCAMQDQQCAITNKLQAQNDYQQYVIERQKANKPIKKTANDFYYSSSCSNSDSCGQNCASSYRICHTNCGGQVIQNTVCTFNCNN